MARRTRRALLEYREAYRLARVLDGSPISIHADNDKMRKERRMRRWAAVWRLLGRPTDPANGNEMKGTKQ